MAYPNTLSEHHLTKARDSIQIHPFSLIYYAMALPTARLWYSIWKEAIDMTKKTKKQTKSKNKSDKQIIDAMGLSAVPVPCPAHPRYGAIQVPRPTKLNPEGCEACWAFYRAKQLVNETLPELYVRKGGNPRKFAEPAVIAREGMGYFKWCAENEQVPTKTGMAVFMGVASDTLRKYRVGEYDRKGDKPTYSAVIKRLDDVIVAGVEQRLLSGKGNPTAAIAWLNNAAGWAQNTRTQVEMGLEIKLTDYSKGTAWSKNEAITASAEDVD
jgi:hypothetical protein